MDMKFGDIVRHRFLKSPDMLVLSGAGNGNGVTCRYWSKSQEKYEKIEFLEKELEKITKNKSSGLIIGVGFCI